MLKTLARFVKYRDVLFSDRTTLSEGANYSFYTLENFAFFYVETDSTDTAYKLRHGYVSGFTKNNRRKISMTFSVVAYDEKERWERIKEVNSIFEPPANPNRTDKQGFYPLEFMAPDGVYRQCNARVIDRPNITEEDHAGCITFEATLIVEGGSCLYSKIPYVIMDRNYTSGISLSDSLPTSFGEYASQEITYGGLSVSPVKATIVALQDNATIGNIQILSIRNNSYTRMFFNIDMNLGDILIVDPTNYIVTLNGVDITGELDLSFGNNFPRLEPGQNPQRLVVNTGWPTQTIQVRRDYRETWC